MLWYNLGCICASLSILRNRYVKKNVLWWPNMASACSDSGRKAPILWCLMVFVGSEVNILLMSWYETLKDTLRLFWSMTRLVKALFSGMKRTFLECYGWSLYIKIYILWRFLKITVYLQYFNYIWIYKDMDSAVFESVVMFPSQSDSNHWEMRIKSTDFGENY